MEAKEGGLTHAPTPPPTPPTPEACIGPAKCHTQHKVCVGYEPETGHVFCCGLPAQRGAPEVPPTQEQSARSCPPAVVSAGQSTATLLDSRLSSRPHARSGVWSAVRRPIVTRAVMTGDDVTGNLLPHVTSPTDFGKRRNGPREKSFFQMLTQMLTQILCGVGRSSDWTVGTPGHVDSTRSHYSVSLVLH